MTNETPNLADDLIMGGDGIAEELGTTKRKIYYLARETDMPTFKIGRELCALRSRLRKWVATKADCAA